MRFTPTPLAGATIVDIEKREDARGWVGRSYCEQEFEAHGLPTRMVQTNTSLTRRSGTLRGMHYQIAPHAEDKLVRCVQGAIWDAIVDIRPESPTYCQWIGVELSEANGRMLLVPKGFAHGFITMTEGAEVLYLMGSRHVPSAATGFRYDDPAFGIRWPAEPAVISRSDLALPCFAG